MTERLPELLSSNQVKSELDLSQRDFLKVKDELHSLRMPGADMRHYSARYVIGYQTYFRGSFNAMPGPTAKRFARSAEAKIAITSAEAGLDERIKEKFVDLGFVNVEEDSRLQPEPLRGIQLADLEAILCLHGHRTIEHWIDTDVFEVYEARQQLYLGETALRGAFSWQRPHSYNGNLLADVVKPTELSVDEASGPQI